jgi:toxin ParE1/3/4
MTVQFLAEADAELKAAAAWYESKRSGLGERFLVEAIDAFIAIEKYPLRYSRVSYRTHRHIRRRLLEHFPYAIVCEVFENRCVVLAVAHTKQKPQFWSGRKST